MATEPRSRATDDHPATARGASIPTTPGAGRSPGLPSAPPAEPRVPPPEQPRTRAGTARAATPRTRAGATWVGICIAALVLVALIIFMLQNTQHVLITFLGLQGTVPLALALLIAGVGVGLVALIVGTFRISQLRRRLSRRL